MVKLSIISEAISKAVVTVSHCGSRANLADIFTKSLAKTPFGDAAWAMGLERAAEVDMPADIIIPDVAFGVPEPTADVKAVVINKVNIDRVFREIMYAINEIPAEGDLDLGPDPDVEVKILMRMMTQG